VRAKLPDTAAPAPFGASLIDRRIQQYATSGLSRQSVLEQLLAARWPLDQLKA